MHGSLLVYCFMNLSNETKAPVKQWMALNEGLKAPVSESKGTFCLFHFFQIVLSEVLNWWPWRLGCIKSICVSYHGFCSQSKWTVNLLHSHIVQLPFDLWPLVTGPEDDFHPQIISFEGCLEVWKGKGIQYFSRNKQKKNWEPLA